MVDYGQWEWTFSWRLEEDHFETDRHAVFDQLGRHKLGSSARPMDDCSRLCQSGKIRTRHGRSTADISSLICCSQCAVAGQLVGGGKAGLGDGQALLGRGCLVSAP